MLRLQEAHGEEAELGLDDEGFALRDHDGTRGWGTCRRTSGYGGGLPVDFLDFYASQLAILAKELKGVDVPSAGTAFLMRRGGLEGAGPVGPGVLRVFRAFDGFRHNLNLSDTLAALSMGGADAVGAGVAATDDQDVLALSSDALIFRELHAGEDAVLLGEELEGKVDAFEVAARGFEVAGGGGAGGKDDGVKRY